MKKAWRRPKMAAAVWPYGQARDAPEPPDWLDVMADQRPSFRLQGEAHMNARPKSQGDKSLSDKPNAKQQDTRQAKRTVAEATGAPKREDAMLAAAQDQVRSPKPSPHMLDSAFDSIERSFRAAKLGTVAVNRKLIDIARANVASSFDLALAVAAARTPMEAARLQIAFFDQRMKALAAQAQELRMLQAELMASTNEPLREHVRRS